MREQLCGAAGIFSGNDVCVAQHAHRPKRDVLEVTDGRCDDEQRAGHRTGKLLYHCEMSARGSRKQSAALTKCTHRSHSPTSSTITWRTSMKSCPARQARTAFTSTTTCSKT